MSNMIKKGWLQRIETFFVKAVWTFVMADSSAFAQRMRGKIYNTRCVIDTNVLITNKDNFLAQRDTVLYHGCYILNYNGTFSLGCNSHLGAYCYVNVCYGKVTIGNDVAIGPGTKIIAYSNHYSKGHKVTDERLTDQINIGNNVFIGANCSILPGSVIEDNVIIGAGTVVKGLLKSNCIYAGIPCKVIETGWYE